MTRLAALPVALVAVALLAIGGTAQADTEICQTINGKTKCVHATGNVSCTTINGETRCTKLEPDQTETPLPEITVPGVDIRQDGKLHVQAGGTDIVVEQGTRP